MASGIRRRQTITNMEHLVQYEDGDGYWQSVIIEAPNWNQVLQKVPDEVRESDEWRICLVSELMTKEEAIHSGLIDDVVPE